MKDIYSRIFIIVFFFTIITLKTTAAESPLNNEQPSQFQQKTPRARRRTRRMKKEVQTRCMQFLAEQQNAEAALHGPPAEALARQSHTQREKNRAQQEDNNQAVCEKICCRCLLH